MHTAGQLLNTHAIPTTDLADRAHAAQDVQRTTFTFEQARFEGRTPGPPQMVTDVVASARTLDHDPSRAALTGNPRVDTQHARRRRPTAKRKARRKVTRTAY